MPPRRPSAPNAGTGGSRATGGSAQGVPATRPTQVTRPAQAARPAPAARPAAAGRPASPGRSAPAGRAAASGRPPSSGRAPSRPLPGVTTPPAGLPSGTGRARPTLIRPVTMLSGVLVVVALLLAPYIRPWVTQRSQLAEGRRQVMALEREVAALAAEKQRWRDPAYVKAQARERLHYVNPGETGLVLLDNGAPAPSRPDPRSVEAALPSGSGGEVWYTKVWDSITAAGR